MKPSGWVAAQEVRRLAGPRAGRTLAVTLVLGLAFGLMVPVMEDRLPAPEASLYSVAATPGSPYVPALEADGRFRFVAGGLGDVRAGDVELYAADRLVSAPTDLGRSAMDAARDAVRAWTEALLAAEGTDAAYPITIDLIEVPPEQQVVLGPPRVPPPAEPSPGPAPDPAPEPEPTPEPTPESTAEPTPEPGPTPEPDPSDPSPGPAPGPTEPASPGTVPEPPPESDPSAPADGRLLPHELQVQGPGIGLLVTFAYVVPMNIVGQVASSGFLQERTRRRGVLTLTAPIGPGAILAGRVLPYAALALMIAAAGTTVAGAGWVGLLAGVVIVALPLSAAVLLGVMARSERELTFLLTAVMTLYAFFLFLPAVFRSLPAIGFLSPLTVVLEAGDGNSVFVGQFLYATLPSALATVALAWTSWAAYRDETLHSPLRLRDKLQQAAVRVTRRVPGTVLAGALLVPFAFALEMLAIAFLVPLGLAFLFPGFLVAVAVIEEGLKRIPLRARMQHPTRPWSAALAVATGFFVGEKLALLVSWAGLGQLDLGIAALRIFGVGTFGLMAVPLAVHFLTSWVQTRGMYANPSRTRQRVSLLGAILLHLAYDALVLTLGGVQ